MEHLGDEILIDKYLESSELRYLDVLVNRHLPKVRSMVYAMVLNDADADEVAQEVFLRVSRAISGFRRSSRFSTWLHSITMNTVRSFLRKRSSSIVEHHADVPETPTAGSLPYDRMITDEKSKLIRDALADLAPQLRAAITLTEIQGMSIREAAQAECCLVATMYWRIHEAKRILRKKLNTGK